MQRKERDFGFSSEESAYIWGRWKQGVSMSDISRPLGKLPGSLHTLIAFHGGIAPSNRSRSSRALSATEREEISRGLSSNKSIRNIACRLNRAPSTISREISRNGGRQAYRAHDADAHAWQKARRPKSCYLNQHPTLKAIVAEKLDLNWSPEQISSWLKKSYPRHRTMRVSHETIYKTLFIQSRGALKKELTAHLRTRRKIRRPKNARAVRGIRGQIIDAISIRERPAEVEDRAVPGHWEGDLITGSNNTHMATLVERHSRFTMLVKLPGKDSASVVKALGKKIRTLPDVLRLSLTWDRGGELANHKQLSLATDLKIYFCDPRSPWQRGSNENTNGLLRQYFPKKTDLSLFSQKQLDKIALQLNERPRKTLNFRTPYDKLHEIVAMTA